MYADLFNLMKNLLERIAKDDFLDTIKCARDFLKINFDDKVNEKNFLLDAKIDTGFGVQQATQNMKEEDVTNFKKECKLFIIQILKKLQDRSPLLYKFVRGASCLSPFVMQVRKTANFRIKIALEYLVDCNIFAATQADKVKSEYKEFISNSNVKKKLKSFDIEKDSLDIFLITICIELKSSDDFIEFIKVILVLFHGNAAVERSFSYNKEFLVENLQEDSLIAQRSVHDYISAKGGKIKNIPISKRMITAFRNSSSKRVAALEKKRIDENENNIRKRKATDEIKILKSKKQRAIDSQVTASEEIAECDSEIKKLENLIKS